jgi:hypothetical protein
MIPLIHTFTSFAEHYTMRAPVLETVDGIPAACSRLPNKKSMV